MARVTVDAVEHVARLAHLSLTDEEKTLFARQLDDVLAYAESIQGLDTSDVPPMSHALASAGLRDDVPRKGLDRERVLEDAPDRADGLFRVPRIIGG